ncbi:MAG: hypothetical protein H7222_08005 [Methylotenera sp.]|nr:hypothetical protein [Oligoflexia bacterium]
MKNRLFNTFILGVMSTQLILLPVPRSILAADPEGASASTDAAESSQFTEAEIAESGAAGDKDKKGFRLWPFRKKAQDKSAFESRKCGNFKIEADLSESGDPLVCRTDDGMGTRRYKTKHAQVQLHVPQAMIDISRDSSEIIDRVLLDTLQSKVDDRFKKTFGWVDSLEDKAQAADLRKAFTALKEKILDQKESEPKHQIRKWLALYPELEEEMTREHPEFAPLICRYEVWKHRESFLKSVGMAAGALGGIGVLLAGPLAWYLWVPALPKILLAAGALKLGSGALKVQGAVAGWDKVKAATLANKMLKLYDETQDYINELRKNPNAENLALIKSLQSQLPSEQELTHLKEVKRGKKRTFLAVGSGLWTSSFGLAAVYGGLKAMKLFSDFKTDAPAQVTNPVGTGGVGPGGVGTGDGGPPPGGFGGDDGG